MATIGIDNLLPLCYDAILLQRDTKAERGKHMNDNELRLITQRERKVRKANYIIQHSRYSLTTRQQKIILFLISKINARDEEFNELRFDVKEFCRVCGLNYNNDDYYTAIKKDLKEISDLSIWIELDNGDETLLRWIERPTIRKNSGIIKIKLDDNLKPYLLNLKKNYTTYQLIFTLKYKSSFSIRLYEYFTSLMYDKENPYTFSISPDDLQSRIGSSYDKYKNFKQRVLIPALSEITNYSDKIVEYVELNRCGEKPTKGQKVTMLRITITPKETEDRIATVLKIDQELNIDSNQLSFEDWYNDR